MPHPCSFRGHCYEHIPFVLTEYLHVPCMQRATLKAITEAFGDRAGLCYCFPFIFFTPEGHSDFVVSCLNCIDTNSCRTFLPNGFDVVVLTASDMKLTFHIFCVWNSVCVCIYIYRTFSGRKKMYSCFKIADLSTFSTNFY